MDKEEQKLKEAIRRCKKLKAEFKKYFKSYTREELQNTLNSYFKSLQIVEMCNANLGGKGIAIPDLEDLIMDYEDMKLDLKTKTDDININV